MREDFFKDPLFQDVVRARLQARGVRNEERLKELTQEILAALTPVRGAKKDLDPNELKMALASIFETSPETSVNGTEEQDDDEPESARQLAATIDMADVVAQIRRKLEAKELAEDETAILLALAEDDAPVTRSVEKVDDAIFKDPLLWKLILIVLRGKGIENKADRQELQGDVLEALVVWISRRGLLDPKVVKAGTVAITRYKAASWWRKRITRGKYDVGNTDDADMYSRPENLSAVELVDIKKVLAEIERMRAAGKISERALAILYALAEEYTLVEHAERTGHSHESVRQMSSRTQRSIVSHLRTVGLAEVVERLAKVGAAVVVALLVIVGATRAGWFGWGHVDPIAHHDPVPVDSGTPAPPAPRLEEVVAEMRDKREKATEEVQRASIALKREEWDDCLERLKAAKALDPMSDEPSLGKACSSGRSRSMDAKQQKPRKHP